MLRNGVVESGIPARIRKPASISTKVVDRGALGTLVEIVKLLRVSVSGQSNNRRNKGDFTGPNVWSKFRVSGLPLPWWFETEERGRLVMVLCGQRRDNRDATH